MSMIERLGFKVYCEVLDILRQLCIEIGKYTKRKFQLYLVRDLIKTLIN
jgi:hypothetical protein